jgi:hypothetical protein
MIACHIKVQEAVGYDGLYMRTEFFSVIMQQVVVILTDILGQPICPVSKG